MESEDNGPIEAGRDTPEEAEDKADEEAGEMAVEHATIPDGPGDLDESAFCRGRPGALGCEPQSKTRNNSPTRLASKSAVWECIKRLHDDHPKAKEGFTHVCTQPGCCFFLKLTKAKDTASWPTTRAGEHLRNRHPEDGGKAGVDRSAAIKVNFAALLYNLYITYLTNQYNRPSWSRNMRVRS